jgi:hypothetical protein
MGDEKEDVLKGLRSLRRHYGHTSPSARILSAAIAEIERLRAFQHTMLEEQARLDKRMDVIERELGHIGGSDVIRDVQPHELKGEWDAGC